jgi:hypothetical protein
MGKFEFFVRRKALLPLWFGLFVALVPYAAFAQQVPPGVECKFGADCKAGPYQVRINFDRTDFNTTDKFILTVERVNSQNDDWQLEPQIIPQRGTSAVPVKFSEASKEGPLKRRAELDFPISGNWFVYLTIKGSEGTGQIRIPVRAEPPPKIPDWIAWAIALSPLLGIAGFALGQWRLVARRKREERLRQSQPQAEDLLAPAESADRETEQQHANTEEYRQV